jgi:hypothetical protein
MNHRKLLAVSLCVLTLALAACGGGDDAAPVAEAAAKAPVTTEAPTTEAPTTAPPTTSPPATTPVTTVPPSTQPSPATPPPPPPPGPAPTISIACPNPSSSGANSVRADFAFDFQATNPALVRWGMEYGDGRSDTANDEAKARREVFWHRYRAPGTFTATAWVEDAIGRRASDSCEFTWTPVVTTSPPQVPQAPPVPQLPQAPQVTTTPHPTDPASLPDPDIAFINSYGSLGGGVYSDDLVAALGKYGAALDRGDLSAASNAAWSVTFSYRLLATYVTILPGSNGPVGTAVRVAMSQCGDAWDHMTTAISGMDAGAINTTNDEVARCSAALTAALAPIVN